MVSDGAAARRARVGRRARCGAKAKAHGARRSKTAACMMIPEDV
jgi:hypothetical protein